jgi:hypothetical protein
MIRFEVAGPDDNETEAGLREQLGIGLGPVIAQLSWIATGKEPNAGLRVIWSLPVEPRDTISVEEFASTVKSGGRKLADAVAAEFIVTAHVEALPALLQAPPQFPIPFPGFGLAVKVTIDC